jgi:hypothetical protein
MKNCHQSAVAGTQSAVAGARSAVAGAIGAVLVVSLAAADLKVDLSKETVGKPPATFEPMVGTWVVAQDGADKVIMIDGRPWVASKDNPTRLLIESARKLYGTSNEELMDNAKQFAYFPVACFAVWTTHEQHDHGEVQTISATRIARRASSST